jgi:hypothetical protein
MQKHSGKKVLEGAFAIPFHPPLAKAFDVCGALLIQQVHYWAYDLENIREGHRWVYNTYEQWSTQLEVYSVETVRKKIKELEGLGVLRVGVFNTARYDRTRWYRIDYAKLGEILTSRLGGMWQALPVPCGKNYQMQVVQAGTTIPNTTTKNTAKKTTSSDVENTEPLNLEEQVGKNKIKNQVKTNPISTYEEEATMASAQELLSNIKSKSLVAGTINAHALGIRWKKHAGADGNYVKELPVKQLSQLKLLLKAIGPEMALKCVDFAWGSWSAFTWEVKALKGHSKAPEVPDIGYLLTYHDVALQLIAKPVAVPKLVAEPLKAKPVVQKAVEPEGKAMLADIEATLAQLESLTKDG